VMPQLQYQACREYLVRVLSAEDIEQEIKSLATNRREAFKLHVEGHSGVNIAEIRGITPMAARQHL
jgi:sigma-70-like protein